MKDRIIRQLLELNQIFYDQFAPSFSSTRGQVQPGVRMLIKRFEKGASILDIGCGNGTLARELIEQDYSGTYLGGDMSEGLLSDAKKLTPESQNIEIEFKLIDLADPGWTDQVNQHRYDWLVSFAVLHHIPGDELRQRIVKNFRKLIKPNGSVAISVWQWQNSLRLHQHVLPWERVGVEPNAVDEGDVLLDWRAGDTLGVRYVHTFTEESLTQLAKESGFNVTETFYSDGKTGDLALYQVWTC